MVRGRSRDGLLGPPGKAGVWAQSRKGRACGEHEEGLLEWLRMESKVTS